MTDRHHNGHQPWHKHLRPDRGVWPGLDADGMTWSEIRARIRRGDRRDDEIEGEEPGAGDMDAGEAQGW